MKIAIAIFATIILSQLLKGIINWIRSGFDSKVFFRDGGFPSSHSSLVSAVTLAMYFEQGFSVLFFASLAFSFIIINDSFRVRKETGDEAKIINKIVEKEKMNFPKLIESEGHTKGQVVAGIIFGLLMSSIVYLIL